MGGGGGGDRIDRIDPKIFTNFVGTKKIVPVGGEAEKPFRHYQKIKLKTNRLYVDIRIVF